MTKTWIMNCPRERAEAIMAVSPYVVVPGPPQEDGVLSAEEMAAKGLVGLYRTDQKKEDQEVARGRQDYFASINQGEMLDTGRARMILKSIL